VENHDSPLPETCIYAIRLKREDGTEEVVTRLCPYFATCQSLGRGCGGIPPIGDALPFKQ
jgi:hypothetical protein